MDMACKILRFSPRGGTAIVRCTAWVAFLVASCVRVASAAFTTIINSPPTEFVYGDPPIGSNTQWNVYEGAVIFDRAFALGDPWTSSDNIEVNIEGAVFPGGLRTSGWREPNTNVVINVRSGAVEAILVDHGNTLNVSGGVIGSEHNGGVHLEGGSTATMVAGAIQGGMWVADASTATITGGEIAEHLGVASGSQALVSGGSIGGYSTDAASRLTLAGGDFRINGAPISGLNVLGDEVQADLPEGNVLTGVLSDGTPLLLMTEGLSGDLIAAGSLHLVNAPIPSAAPAVLQLPGDEVPSGLRTGQRLTVAAGGIAPKGFNATWGSTVAVDGGVVGDRFHAAGAEVNVASGRVGELALFGRGSVLNLSGGAVGSNLNIGNGASFNMTGGTVGWLFEALPGSDVRIAGGNVGRNAQAYEDSRVQLVGGEFRIDGVPVTGMDGVGATRRFDLPPNAVLSGTYADGRQFTFSTDRWDYFAPGTLTLESAPLPAPGPTVIRAPHDALPPGLRAGQMLVVSEGGVVSDNFTAGWGSVVNVDGGRLGGEFEAVGALVNVTGGTVGWGFNAYYGTVANISGGTFEGYVQASRGSVMNITGGVLTYILTVSGGGVVNVSGGSIVEFGYVNVYGGSSFNVAGGWIGDTVMVGERSVFNLSGGQIGSRVYVSGDSFANVSGGTLGDEFSVGGGSRLLLTGGDFRLDGIPIEGLPSYGLSAPIDVPAGSVLSGTLSDGTPFAFSDSDGDHFEAGSVRLLQWPYPLPAPPTIDLGDGRTAPTGVRSGESLVVVAAHPLGDNFNAGWGSTVTIAGGAVGRNFEALGAQVLVTDGDVGEDFDALSGSVVTIAGGAFARGFTAHRGSVVNILDGQFPYGLTAGRGSVVNVAGGDVTERLDLALGSEVNLFGADFSLDGAPILELVPGEPFDLATSSGMLGGVLADGTDFRLWLGSGFPTSTTVPPVRITVTLTAIAAPEPASAGMAISAIAVMIARRRARTSRRAR